MGDAEAHQVLRCCDRPENIEERSTENPFAKIRHCKACGKNHYYLKAQPVRLGAKLGK